MPRSIKLLIMSCCVVFAAGISVSMLRGEVPGKQRKSPDKSTAAKAASKQVQVVVDAPPMRSPEPGSPEAKRMAAFQARVKAGLVPTVILDGRSKMVRPKGNRMPDFVPTTIVPQKGISGELLAFQQKLSPAFAANDPIPPSRINHFAWLKAHPNVRIFGWYGTVMGSEVQDDSSVIVAIEFHAKTEITGMRAFVRDYVTEKYHISNGMLNLIDTDAGINNPAIQVITSF